MVREVVFYRTPSGRSPIEDFLDTLPSKHARKVAWVLSLVEDLELVPTQYFQKMRGTEDLWEVRVRAGSDIYRLLGFFDGPRLVVLAHAFQKKTQKTPLQAIRLAAERKREYFHQRGRR